MHHYRPPHKHLVLVAGSALLLVGAGWFMKGVLNTSSLTLKNPITLPAQQWAKFPGAKLEGDNVRISKLPRLIVNQDGTGGQPNPAVNVQGQHLTYENDFAISARLGDISNGIASLQFYGQLPRIYDEWRYQSPSVEVSFADSTVNLKQWDGESANPIESHDYKVNLANTAQLTLQRHDENLEVRVNNHKLATLPDHNLFDAHTLWLGATAADGDWQLQSLQASGGDDVKLANPLTEKTSTDPQRLSALATAKRPDFRFGATMSLFPLVSDASYSHLSTEFNSMTTENDMKAQFIHPSKDTYSFEYADALVDAAEQRQQVVHGHALVFGEANPTWMQHTPSNELNNVMVDHVKTIVEHYKGRVSEWDVVNEPFSDTNSDYGKGGNGLRQHIWYKAMGEQYIGDAFQAARLADPSAKLYLNDYGLEEDGPRWTALLALIERLQRTQVPIDGIGFEAHVYDPGDEINQKVLAQHLQILAKRGLVARISEIDVHGDDPTLQANQYSQTLATCLKAPNCTGYTTWGISDVYGSTTEVNKYPLALGNDLLWDQDFQPKLTLKQIKQTLSNN